MPVALALALLAQTPDPLVVLSTSAREGVGPEVQAVVSAVERELAAAGAAAAALAAKPDATACGGLRTCVAEIAAKLGPRAWIVGVDVGRLGRSVAVSLEVVDANGALVASQRFTAPAAAWELRGLPVIRALAADLLKARPAVVADDLKAAPPPSEPAPQVALTPAPQPTPAPVIVATEPSRGPRIAAWGSAGAAAVSAVIAVAFLALGLGDQSAISSSLDGMSSSLTRAMLNDAASRGNTRLSVSLAMGIGAAVLAAVSAVLFLGAPQ